MKKALKSIGIILLAVVVLAGGFIGFLTLTEYTPGPTSMAEVKLLPDGSPDLAAGETLTVLSWNMGYGGLDQEEDFFMDGGSRVNPISQAHVESNLSAIHDYLGSSDADIILLQEIDRDSARSGHVDELEQMGDLGMGYAFAANYRCSFVPFPWPPIGKVDSGVATLFSRTMKDGAVRVSLPCPFTWPVRVANLKRCLLVSRFPMEDGQELVVVNFHLEAYDDGEGKIAQTQQLLQVLQEEYAKGNFVIAGGDFNQAFPGSLEKYPIINPELWVPGTLETDLLPEGWCFAYDLETPTCRSLDRALDTTDPEMQYYLIDGFLVSPNITVEQVQTQDLGFRNSDHNPVKLEITLNG